MKSQTCGRCKFTWSEADRAWDIALASGHCPKCRSSLTVPVIEAVTPIVQGEATLSQRELTTETPTRGRINSVQRGILLVCAVLIFSMLVFPPFELMGRGLGYSLVFQPPRTNARVDAVLLVVQWLGVVLIGAGLFVVARDVPTGPATVSPRSMRSLLAGLRIFRGIIAVVGLYQLLTLLPVFTWLSDLSAVTVNMFVIFSVKLAIATISFGLCAPATCDQQPPQEALRHSPPGTKYAVAAVRRSKASPLFTNTVSG
jgi:hypothetical protein